MTSPDDHGEPEDFDPYAELRNNPPGLGGFLGKGRRPRKRKPVSRAKAIIVFLVIALLFYLALIGYRAFDLFGEGGFTNITLGVAVLVIPLIGVWVVIAELRFGVATEILADQLEAEGAEPEPELPTTPSGRIQREAADALFTVRKGAVEADAGNWRAWYRLALAYDYAGDRRRAREAMRTAISKADLRRSAAG